MAHRELPEFERAADCLAKAWTLAADQSPPDAENAAFLAEADELLSPR